MQWSILPAGESTMTTPLCPEGTCVVETLLDDSFYGMEERSATIVGVASLQHQGPNGRSLEVVVRSEMDFTTEISLGASTAESAGDGIVDDNGKNIGANGSSSSAGNRSSVMGWLFPVLAVVLVAIVCTVVVIRKRNLRTASV